MFGSEVLEVAIGIIFVFLLVGVLCSALREGIEALTKTRAAYLERGIRELLHDKDARAREAAQQRPPATPQTPGLARAFYEHPLIFSLYAADYTPGAATDRIPVFALGRRLPSYIPSRNFAVALMDLAVRGPVSGSDGADPSAPAISLDALRQNVRNLGSPAVQRVLLTAIDAAHGDVDQVQAALQAWYDSAMDRVSGWYKRSTYWIVFWIGLALAVGLNVDAITIARFLYHNDAARTAIVARAEKVTGDTAYLTRSYAQVKQDLDSLALPIGWPAPPATATTSASTVTATPNPVLAAVGQGWPVLGWLTTALAATLGAPFWFDLLNKIMVIRSTVKPHEKSPEEASEDRQLHVTTGGASTPPPTA